MSSDVTEPVRIRTDFIRLDQFLKLADAVAGGGEAKVRIQTGDVRVNGQLETRRGRKLRPGDEVEIDNRSLLVATSS